MEKGNRKAAVKKLKQLVITPTIETSFFRERIEKSFCADYLPNNVDYSYQNFSDVPCGVLLPEVFSRSRLMIYIHGGSFVGGTCASYCSFCASLAHISATKIIVPEFRLSPEHPFPAALEDIQAVLREILPVEKNVIIAADGSGASIALACAVNMRGKYRHSIQHILLFSPFLDLSSTSPILTDKKAADEVLSSEALRRCADIYTYHSNLKNPLVSPMHASNDMLEDFPPVYIQAGGRELLLSDIHRFAKKLEENNVPHTLDIEPDMMFMFQMADEFLPQSHRAVERAGKYIKQTGEHDEQ